MSTICGYNSLGGSLTANITAGYTCAVNYSLGLWNICTLSASDCSMGGFCWDNSTCSTGCGPYKGYTGNPYIDTSYCASHGYCSTLLSYRGSGDVFTNIDCGQVATTNIIYQNNPALTTASTSTTTKASSSSSSRPSSSRSTTPSSTIPPPSPAPSITSQAPLTTTSTSPSIPVSPPHRSNNAGAIGGGVVGGVAGLALILLAILFFLRRRRANRAQSPVIWDNGKFHDSPPRPQADTPMLSNIPPVIGLRNEGSQSFLGLYDEEYASRGSARHSRSELQNYG